MKPVLEVNGLTVEYPDGFVLHPVSFSLGAGETLAVIGESGSGKTTLVRAIADLFSCRWARVSGEVLLDGEDLLRAGERRMKELRMRRIAVVFQNPASMLNPALRLREQLNEVLCKQFPRREWKERSRALMQRVGLEEALLDRYPGSLSGGMAQRFLVACAIALSPGLIVLDEPTSALDTEAASSLAKLLIQLQRETCCAYLLITHDLSFASALSNRMLVLYRGQVEEEGDTAALLERPRHPYTRGLIGASAELMPLRDLWGIRGAPPPPAGGCPFYGRCTQSVLACSQSRPALTPVVGEPGRNVCCHRGGINTRLEAAGIRKAFDGRTVLDGASLRVQSGETVALIGPSGSGKTTLSLILSGFLQPDGGTVRFDGEPADFSRLHRMAGGLQMVFQNSEAALDPAFSVGEAVCEARLLAGLPEREERGRDALREVGLPDTDGFWNSRVSHLSGGQMQRLCLARALTMEPALLIADEPTSMLDPSSKANLLRLLKGLQNTRGFSMLMVTHDLSAAAKVAERAYRMASGRPEELSLETLRTLGSGK